MYGGQSFVFLVFFSLFLSLLEHLDRQPTFHILPCGGCASMHGSYAYINSGWLTLSLYPQTSLKEIQRNVNYLHSV